MRWFKSVPTHSFLQTHARPYVPQDPLRSTVGSAVASFAFPPLSGVRAQLHLLLHLLTQLRYLSGGIAGHGVDADSWNPRRLLQ